MATTVRYTAVDGEVLAEKRGGARFAYVPDPLGSVVAKLDNTQTKTDTYEYWPYGEVATRTGTSVSPYQFVGTLGYYSDSSNLTYVRARYFHHAGLGQFVSRAPFEQQIAGESPYGYAFCSPLTHFDPLGLDPSGCPVYDCSTYPDSPCEFARAVGADYYKGKHSGGGVVCCNGRQYSCSWQPPITLSGGNALTGIDSCTIAHEDCHRKRAPACPPHGFKPVGEEQRYGAMDECRCARVEIACLRKNIGNCGKNQECRYWYNLRIKQMCYYASNMCSYVGKRFRC
jgi:RHS repeat-associated protein